MKKLLILLALLLALSGTSLAYNDATEEYFGGLGLFYELMEPYIYDEEEGYFQIFGGSDGEDPTDVGGGFELLASYGNPKHPFGVLIYKDGYENLWTRIYSAQDPKNPQEILYFEHGLYLNYFRSYLDVDFYEDSGSNYVVITERNNFAGGENEKNEYYFQITGDSAEEVSAISPSADLASPLWSVTADEFVSGYVDEQLLYELMFSGWGNLAVDRLRENNENSQILQYFGSVEEKDQVLYAAFPLLYVDQLDGAQLPYLISAIYGIGENPLVLPETLALSKDGIPSMVPMVVEEGPYTGNRGALEELYERIYHLPLPSGTYKGEGGMVVDTREGFTATLSGYEDQVYEVLSMTMEDFQVDGEVATANLRGLLRVGVPYTDAIWSEDKTAQVLFTRGDGGKIVPVARLSGGGMEEAREKYPQLFEEVAEVPGEEPAAPREELPVEESQPGKKGESGSISKKLLLLILPLILAVGAAVLIFFLAKGKKKKRYCGNCGHELGEQSKFCNNCGHSTGLGEESHSED
ncbi:MAG: zinc ribbon domain-containing protein [Tissierellia bacterium]|nr:zinc ribbon domain-containing protein [Tissierellia bacterium]